MAFATVLEPDVMSKSMTTTWKDVHLLAAHLMSVKPVSIFRDLRTSPISFVVSHGGTVQRAEQTPRIETPQPASLVLAAYRRS